MKVRKGDRLNVLASRVEAYERRRFPMELPGAVEAIKLTTRLGDLLVPPGNRLEALKGDRAGQASVRVNDQWRVCFRLRDGAAQEVEIVDYH